MQMDPKKKLENGKTLCLFSGLVLAVFSQSALTQQVWWTILGGLFLTVAVFDELVLLRLQNADPDKANPMLFPILLCLLVLLITIPFGTAASAVRYFKAEDNVSYAAKKETAVVNRVYGDDAVVVIKDSHKDKPVTVLKAGALYGRKAAEEVVLPAQLETISNGAFVGCAKLRELTLPDTVTKIGDNAFVNCKSLERITIPASVTKIPKSAFRGCPKTLVIVGEPGSAAQTFAEKHYQFEPLAP